MCVQGGCSTYYYPSFDSPFSYQELTKKLPLQAVERQVQCELSNFISDYADSKNPPSNIVLDPNKPASVTVNIQTDLSGKAQFVGIDLSKIGLSAIANVITPSQKVPSLQASFAPKETVSSQIDFALPQSNNDVYTVIENPTNPKADWHLRLTKDSFQFIPAKDGVIPPGKDGKPGPAPNPGVIPSGFTFSDYVFVKKHGSKQIASIGYESIHGGDFYKKAKNPTNGNPITRHDYNPKLMPGQALIKGLNTDPYYNDFKRVSFNDGTIAGIKLADDTIGNCDKDYTGGSSLLNKLYIKEWLEDYFYGPNKNGENKGLLDGEGINEPVIDPVTRLPAKVASAVCLAKLTLKTQLALVFDASAGVNPVFGATYLVPISGVNLDLSPALTNYIQIVFNLQNSENSDLCNQLANSQPIVSIGPSH